jgi:hypothetical protein
MIFPVPREVKAEKVQWGTEKATLLRAAAFRFEATMAMTLLLLSGVAVLHARGQTEVCWSVRGLNIGRSGSEAEALLPSIIDRLGSEVSSQ